MYISLDPKGNPNLVEAEARKIKPTMMFNVPCKRKSGMLDQPTTNKDNFITIDCTNYWSKIRKNKQEPNHKFKRQVNNESLKRCYGYNGKKDHINEECWLVLKYNNFTIKSLQWEYHIRETWPTMYVNKKKDVGVIGCILGVQECGLSTTLQQLKLKITKLT